MLVAISLVLSSSAVQTRLAKMITNKVNEKYGTTILVEKVDFSSLRNVKLKNVLINYYSNSISYV